MTTGVGRGEFVWRHSIARPRKPPIIHKDLADIAYLTELQPIFYPKFRCHGNRDHPGVNLNNAII